MICSTSHHNHSSKSTQGVRQRLSQRNCRFCKQTPFKFFETHRGSSRIKMATAKAKDTVHGMSVKQRLEHLLSGFLIFENNRCDEYVPADIIKFCVDYTGISKYNSYDLIKSNTELKMELEAKQKREKIIGRMKYPCNEMRVVLCGSKNVGKSNILLRFKCGEFLDEYDPTIEDGYRKQTVVDGMVFLWDILDAFQQFEFEQMAQQWMEIGDYFLFIYDISNRNSFQKIPSYIDAIDRIKREYDGENEWFGVIIGNKCDLMEQRQISIKEGEELTDKYENLTFMEASPKNDINCVKAFHVCAQWYLKNKFMEDYMDGNYSTNSRSSCCVLL